MLKENPNALRFTRIQLKNWRNFRHLEIPLGPRVFLVGPNGVGKSNLLDAFRFLQQLVVPRGGLQTAIQDRGGLTRLRSFAARPEEAVEVGVSLGTDHRQDVWEYRLSFRESHDSDSTIISEKVLFEGSKALARPDEKDLKDPVRLQQTALEQSSLNEPLRDVTRILSGLLYLAVDPARRERRSIATVLTPTRLPARVEWMTQAIQAAIPTIEALELDRDTGQWRARFLPSGQWLTEDDLSNGTLRLIELLWAFGGTSSGHLLLENPESRLPSHVVPWLPQLFAQMANQGRQALVSTHSPTLLDDEGIGLDEILLLEPSLQKGTVVRLGLADPNIVSVAECGLPIGELLLAASRPAGASFLAKAFAEDKDELGQKLP